MKIIFLDYDGVVNNLVFHEVNGEPTYYDENNSTEKVNDFQAMAWLNKICREFDCAIVVTSTWRGRDDYKKCLTRAGLANGIPILGKTPSLSHMQHETRGREIWQWFRDNPQYDEQLEDFIILDDDTDMWMLSDHLIQTNTYRGLGFEEYSKICQRWEKDKNGTKT